MSQLTLSTEASSGRGRGLTEFLKDLWNLGDSYAFRTREIPKIRERFAATFKQDSPWMAIDGAALDKCPALFPFLMVTAPRWNPHAVIVGGPVVEVQQQLTISVERLRASTSSWSVAVHRLADNGLVFSRSSGEVVDAVIDAPLEPGKYKLVLRAYGPSDELYSPALVIDHATVLGSQRVAHDNNAFYRRAPLDSFDYYKRLQGLSLGLVKYKRWLGEQTVKKHFLPVADKDTRFEFGYLYADQELALAFDPAELQQHAVYFCFYSEASFPVYWCEVKEPAFRFCAEGAAGAYVVRVVDLG